MLDPFEQEQFEAERPRARVTPLMWCVVGALVVLAIVVAVVGHGPVAGAAFTAMVIVLLLFAIAVGNPFRERPRARFPMRLTRGLLSQPTPDQRPDWDIAPRGPGEPRA